MSVKICLLKSGEEVVADVKELVNADDQFVGYVFHKPVLITYNNPEMLLEEDASLSLSFQPWFPLSKTDIPVSPDWVITAVDPINQIEQMYTDSLLKKKDDADTSDETADSGSGDNQTRYSSRIIQIPSSHELMMLDLKLENLIVDSPNHMKLLKEN